MKPENPRSYKLRLRAPMSAEQCRAFFEYLANPGKSWLILVRGGSLSCGQPGPVAIQSLVSIQPNNMGKQYAVLSGNIPTVG